MSAITRRVFLGSAAAAAATTTLGCRASAGTAAASPNETLRVAVVGLRGRGNDHVNNYAKLPGVEVAALCDVDRNVLEAAKARAIEAGATDPLTIVDYRELLERDDIDAVSIATPNHWHALQAVWACQAGKDVYLEKPVSHNVWEGRQIVHAAAKYDRIVQTGTQIRSSPSIQDALAWVNEGHIGEIQLVRGLCYKPRQSIGRVEGAQKIDPAVDYDLWCGPAPRKPLMRERLHYDWHWVFDTGNGDLGNQGIHQMDIARWALGESALPARTISVGGRFGYVDDGNTPNTQFVYHDYERAPLLFEVRGLPRDLKAQKEEWRRRGMDEYLGARIGVIVHCEGGHLQIPSYTEATAFDGKGKKLEKWDGGANHYANFVDAVRSRRSEDLTASIEDGHLSSALCHLGNISYLRGEAGGPAKVSKIASKLRNAGDTADRFLDHLVQNGIDPEVEQPIVGPWLTIDPDTETIEGDIEASRLLTREYREPFVVPRTV
ncbi:MAG: Gfo/Idh/MocA family oxidoreductase [Acidobacteria bacterium]|nr:Gfo/Idh/MocA family oxidoreductase [Acidobacteriota bacterium]